MRHTASTTLTLQQTRDHNVTRQRWLLIGMLMGYAALGHFNRVGITVAGDEVFIPLIKIPETRMGWVYTAFLIVYTIGMLPGGWLIDRIGPGRALAIFGITMGTFSILTGVIGWITLDPVGLWLGLLVIRGLGGVCNAPLHPGAARVVSDIMPSGQQATANGMITAGALVGISFCFPALGWLMDTFSWQSAFVVGGSLLLVYGIGWLVVAVPRLNAASAQAQHVATDTSDLPPGTRSVMPPTRPPFSVLVANRTLWLLTLSYAAYGYFQYLFFYWLGYYFKEILDIPPQRARWATTWIMLTMGLGMVVGGRLTDIASRRWGIVRGRRVVVIAGMGLGAVFGLAGVGSSWIIARFPVLGLENEAFLMTSICLALSMASAGMCEGVFWTTSTDIGGDAGGTAGAFMNTGGNIGGLIAPVLTPIVAEQFGWTIAIGLACVISAVGGLIWLLITPPTRRNAPTPADVPAD